MGWEKGGSIRQYNALFYFWTKFEGEGKGGRDYLGIWFACPFTYVCK